MVTRFAAVLALGLQASCTSPQAQKSAPAPPATPPVTIQAPAPPAPPELPPAAVVDSLRANGHDDTAALDSIVRLAGSQTAAGVVVVRLIGAFVDTGAFALPEGVRLEGPASIRFTNADIGGYGYVNMSSHTAVVDVDITCPWADQSYNPAGRKHPGFNSGGASPSRMTRGIYLIRVSARGAPGAGFNSGSYVDSVGIWQSAFDDNGDAGVQIDPGVYHFSVIGSRAARNRNNGFDVNGSWGYIAFDTATGNGRADVSYPDGSSDLSGFNVWSSPCPLGERCDAQGNVFEWDVATGNAAHGYTVNGGGPFAATVGTVLRHVSASANGSIAFHVNGSYSLDGIGDNRGTVLDGVSGELYVQHLGGAPGRFIAGLRLVGDTFTRTLIDAPGVDQVLTGP